MPEADPPVGAVDIETLGRIEFRLSKSNRFETVSLRPTVAPNTVVATFDTGYFPRVVRRAKLEITWFVTGDFNVHYSEEYDDGASWECRWDRHPNEHNARGHFHPPPDAETPGEDREYADDWRDVFSGVLSTLDVRIESFWE